MLKMSAIVASLAVSAAGVATLPNAEAAPARPAAHHHVRGYTPPPLRWHACDTAGLQAAGAQCADLVVPVNYARPSGRKITVAVSRVEHTSTRYQGVMLVNPGGPGGSGIGLATLGRYVPGTVAQDYDWIGFDPRGVGESRPALTCNNSLIGFDRPPYDPAYGSAPAWLRLSKSYARACKNSAAGRIGLLNHLKTVDNVADMESLRKALHQRRINYYGFSYGTYLGQVYATLHPKRVRRFVWDGVVDPTRVWYKSNQDQDRGFQKNINVYFGWLAKYDNLYHLGTTRAEVARGFYAERRKLDRHAAGGIIGGDELTDVLQSAAYYVYDWVGLAEAYSALVHDGDYAGIQARLADPTTPGADNGNAVYLGTICTDAPWPGLRKTFADNRRLNRVAPFLTWSNAWFNGPCSYWPAKSAKRPVHVTGARVRSHILLISETSDAATPYSGALRVRRLFPRSSLIEGVGGTTHAGSLSGVSCTDDTIAQYLTDGTVPARRSGNRSDLQCPPVPQPEPTASASAQRRSATSGDLAQLRRQLAEAQLR